MKISKRSLLIPFLVLSFLAGREKATAEDYLWQAGSGFWDDDNNWDIFGHPNAAGDSATFNAAGPPTFNVSLNSGTFTVGRMFMNGDSADGYTFSSGTLNLGGSALIQVDTHNTNPDFASDLTLNLLANSTIDTTLANTTFQINGQITGAFSLTKEGPGTLTLSGTNTYSGGTNITEGTVQISNDNNLGATTGGVNLSNNATLQTLANITFNAARTFTVDATGGTIDLFSHTSTLNGAISGAGVLSVINTTGGFGTLTLTGNNSGLTGGLSIGSANLNDVTVVVSADNNLGAPTAPLSIQDNGTVEVTASFSSARPVHLPESIGNFLVDSLAILNLTGLIDGPGHLQKIGQGTLVLTNNNTYSGSTILSGGSLYSDVSPAGPTNQAFGTGLINILIDGVVLGSHISGEYIPNALLVQANFSVTPAAGGLTFSGDVDLGATTRTITNTMSNSPSTAFFSGVISGTGGLTLNSTNNGYFEFTGANANTYGGLTTVKASTTLNLNKTAGVNAIPGDVTIDFTGSLQLEAANQISDIATVTDNGTFNLVTSPETIGTLNGSGNVLLSSTGILTVGAGNFDGRIIDNPTLGALVKDTAGTLILSGNNTYSGGTTINGGVLAVGNINALGVGNVLVNSGTLQTFGSNRTIGVGSNYTQNGGGTLQLQIGGTNAGIDSDVLNVTGNAALSGTLALVRINNYNPANGDRVNIITDGAGHTGTFDNIVSNFGMLQPTVHYDEALDVYILFQLNSFSGLTGLTSNQKSVAHELDNVINDPAAAPLINFLALEQVGALPHDFDLIAPEELASIYEIGFSQAVVQNNNLQRRMDDIRAGSNGFCANGFTPQVSGKDYTKESDGKVSLPDKNTHDIYTPSADNRWGVFVTGSGDFVTVSNDDLNARGYDITTGNFTVGADYRLCDHFAIGIDAGYSRSTADLVDNGRVDVDGGKIGAYATVFGKGLFGSKFYVDGGVGGGLNSYDTRRTGLQDVFVRGDTDGTEFNAMISYGSDWTFGCFNVGTWSTVQYTNVSIDEFTETGSLAPLEIQDQDENSFRATTGVHASYDIKAGHFLFRPEVRVAYQHEYCDSAYQVDSRLASGAGDVFRVRGPNIGRDAALVGTGLSMQWNNRLSTYVYYDGVLGRNNYDNNAVSGGFRIGF
jgi:outer membrane autotransporter protein